MALRFKENPAMLDGPDKEDFFVRVPDDQGEGWHDAWLAPLPYSQVKAMNVTRDPGDLEKLSRLPATDGILELGFFSMGGAIQDERDDRPFFPYLCAAVDHSSGFLFAQEIGRRSTRAFELVKVCLITLEQIGQLPAESRVSDPETFDLVKPLTDQLGIGLKLVKTLKGLNQVKRSFSEFAALSPGV